MLQEFMDKIIIHEEDLGDYLALFQTFLYDEAF
jgi:hypothetical protein